MLKIQGKVQVQQDQDTGKVCSRSPASLTTATTHLSPNQCSSWISRGKLRPKFGLDSTNSIWTRGPLRNSFHCTACSPLLIMQPQIVHTPTRDIQTLVHKEM